MSFIWSFIQRSTPTVKAAECVEEEEEEELVDPQKMLREKCGKTSKCVPLKNLLDDCTERVNSKTKTSETCHQELVFYLNCVDHCVSKTLFQYLK